MKYYYILFFQNFKFDKTFILFLFLLLYRFLIKKEILNIYRYKIHSILEFE